MQWILTGPNKNLTSESRNNSFEKCFFCNPFMMQFFETKRQMSYNSVPGSQCQVSNYFKTPLSVGLGIMLHQTTRSKSLINILYDMNMYILYNKVVCIKQDGAEAVRKKVQDKSGVYSFLHYTLQESFFRN